MMLRASWWRCASTRVRSAGARPSLLAPRGLCAKRQWMPMSTRRRSRTNSLHAALRVARGPSRCANAWPPCPSAPSMRVVALLAPQMHTCACARAAACVGEGARGGRGGAAAAQMHACAATAARPAPARTRAAGAAGPSQQADRQASKQAGRQPQARPRAAHRLPQQLLVRDVHRHRVAARVPVQPHALGAQPQAAHAQAQQRRELQAPPQHWVVPNEGLPARGVAPARAQALVHPRGGPRAVPGRAKVRVSVRVGVRAVMGGRGGGWGEGGGGHTWGRGAGARAIHACMP